MMSQYMMSIYIIKGQEREDKLKIVEKAKGREGDFFGGFDEKESGMDHICDSDKWKERKKIGL